MCERLTRLLPREIVSLEAKTCELTTFGTDGVVSAYLAPRSRKELVKCVVACQSAGIAYRVIGMGSNLLLSPKLEDLALITTRHMNEKFTLHQTSVKVGAGAKLSNLILWCADRGLSGLENLFGIPATVGGAIVNNAGAFGAQTCDTLESIDVLDGNTIRQIPREELTFSEHYSSLRGSGLVLLGAQFRLRRLAPSVIHSIIKDCFSQRQQKQPFGKSAGSVFKKTPMGPAAIFIDRAGLKGLTRGGAKISEKHANFIINQGGATYEDIRWLVEKVKSEVRKQMGLRLEEEIETIGENNANYR